MKNEDFKILIIGLGLIGGSYAQAFKSQGYFVGGIDVNQDSINYALNNGFIDVGESEYSENFIKNFDIVIFSLYPNVLLKTIENIKDYFKQGAIISDTTGIKSGIVYKIEEILPKTCEFIGAHPMAGKEVSGIKNSSKDIFINANYIITPTKNSTRKGIETAKKIGEVLKFRQISILTPEKHDEMIGFLSQLTHVIAVSLMTAKDSEHLVDYTGDSFRDLTRIAKINDEMWAQLFNLNKEALLKEMNAFLDKFVEIKNCIENSDNEKLKEIMKLSTKRRETFDK